MELPPPNTPGLQEALDVAARCCVERIDVVAVHTELFDQLGSASVSMLFADGSSVTFTGVRFQAARAVGALWDTAGSLRIAGVVRTDARIVAEVCVADVCVSVSAASLRAALPPR